MCDTCGCGVTVDATDRDKDTNKENSESIRVMRGLMEGNDHQAKHNREHFDRHGVIAVNLMSSPGSGKTRLLEETASAIANTCRMMVIEGDLETENDAARIRAKGVPAIQITTGNACHLDAAMVHDALHHVSLEDVDVVFIENVGNLVCPASFDLGQHLNVVLLSVTEGDDKPEKYPVMFRAADLIILSKCDLLRVIDDFDTGKARAAIDNLGRPVSVIEIATGKHASIEEWLHWLQTSMTQHLNPPLSLSQSQSLPKRTA